MATDPATLPNTKTGYQAGVPNGFFTARELEYLNGQGIKPRYRPSNTKKSDEVEVKEGEKNE